MRSGYLPMQTIDYQLFVDRTGKFRRSKEIGLQFFCKSTSQSTKTDHMLISWRTFNELADAIVTGQGWISWAHLCRNGIKRARIENGQLECFVYTNIEPTRSVYITQKRIREKFIPYWPHMRMLESEIGPLRSRIEILNSVPDFHYIIMEQVDIRKWAPSFSRANTEPRFEVIEQAAGEDGRLTAHYRTSWCMSDPENWRRTWNKRKARILQDTSPWKLTPGGGFKYFFIINPIWGRFPILLIFLRWVDTTN